MNIKTALKRKNKLVGLISEEFAKASKYNSIVVGETRPYGATSAIEKWQELSEELVLLKTKIHKANQPVYDKIFRLSELKNQVKQLKNLDCTSGTQSVGIYGRMNSEPTIKDAEIDVVTKDNMVKSIEAKIEAIQDELDTFNHLTQIED